MKTLPAFPSQCRRHSPISSHGRTIQAGDMKRSRHHNSHKSGDIFSQWVSIHSCIGEGWDTKGKRMFKKGEDLTAFISNCNVDMFSNRPPGPKRRELGSSEAQCLPLTANPAASFAAGIQELLPDPLLLWRPRSHFHSSYIGS